MPHYTVWNAPRNLCVAEYDAESPVPPYTIDLKYNGPDFVTRLDGNDVPLANLQVTWPAFDFLRRFEPQERIAARTLAKSDPVVEDFMDLLGRATNVVSDDPDTVAGMNYLVAIGVLTVARKNAILGG
jgi:hypothetical protein